MKKKIIFYITGAVLSIVYGLSCQYAVRNQNDLASMFMVMSFGFVFLLPIGLGSLTVYFAETAQQSSWPFRILAPILVSTISLIITMLVGLEGTICLFMAWPIYAVLSTVGGILTGIIIEQNKNIKNLCYLSMVLFSPFGAGVIENNYPLDYEFREVHTNIVVYANAETVWKNITRISKITENQDGFFYRMGFPKPVEATLSREGVGGIRIASFEKGLTFTETITDWETNKKIAFVIKSDPEETPLTTLDEHVTVGGRYFDTLKGEYGIYTGDKPDDIVILHLMSRYRLSTRFNTYASLWADFLMKDIQENILRVIKSRCEKERK